MSNLTPTQRLKVAEACTGLKCKVLGKFVRVYHEQFSLWWNPGELGYYELKQKGALTTKVAQLIEALPEDRSSQPAWVGYYVRLGKTLSTSDVDALEQLAHELLEGV
jgi:hypothetical protein